MQQYISDMLIALQRVTPEQAFLLRAHVGNYSLFVSGIFHSGMYEYDSKFAYIRLQEAQTFFNVKGVTGIELKVRDIDDARRITRAV